MERNHRLIVWSLMLLSFLDIGASVPVRAEEDVMVNCYVKTDEGYMLINNANVFDVSQSAATCNAMYIECKGQCIGCVDAEGEQDCYDVTGNKLRKSSD